MLQYDVARESINTHSSHVLEQVERKLECLDDFRTKISQESLKKNL